MPDPIHQPHDRLFKLGFSDPANAGAFLRTQLEPAVAEAIDWSSLKLESGSFIDNHLVGSESDLLFAATLAGAPCRIYLLFEHQSTEDRWIALRLLRYFVRIWEHHRRESPALALPVILPVVLAQDSRVWDLPQAFGALVGLSESLRPVLQRYIPDFQFHLVQLAALPYDRLLGTPAGIITLRVLKAERADDLLGDAVWDEELLSDVSAEFLDVIWHYLITAGSVDLNQFRRKVLNVASPVIRDQTMTLAEQLRREGRQEGRLDALHDYVLDELSERFGDLPVPVRDAVTEITDEARLRELHRAAIRAPALEAFLDSLKR